MQRVVTPSVISLETLEELLESRNAILSAWKQGAIHYDLAQERLRALSVRDKTGNYWRIRPTSSGGVLVKVSIKGTAELADPRTFVPIPAALSAWRKAVIWCVGGAWIYVASQYLLA